MSGIISADKKRLRWLWPAGALLLSAAFVLLARNITADRADPLTAAQRAWLKAHPVIRLAPDPDFPPVEFFDRKGGYNGVTADYVALIEKKLGIRIQIVRLRNWDEIISKAKSRQIDAYVATKTPQRAEYMLFTKPFLEFPVVIIAREKAKAPLSLEKLHGMKVSVVSEYAAHNFIAYNHPKLNLDLVPDVGTGLRKVSFGLSDAFVENLATATYFIEKEGITNLRIVGESGYFYRMGFCTRKDWPELNRILDKGLAAISADEKKAVYEKWIPLEPRSLFTSREFQVGLLAALAAILVIVAAIIAWNRTLARQVRLRTKELETELTERRIVEEKLRFTQFAVDNTVDQAFWMTEDGRLFYVNDAACRTLGYSRDELGGMSIPDIDPTFPPEVFAKHWRELQENGHVRLETLHRAKDGRVYPVEIRANHVVFDGREYNCAFATDITERKQAEEALRRLNRELRAISNCNQTLMRAEDEQTLLNDICRIICDEAGYHMAWVGFAEHDEAKSVRPAAWAGVEDSYLANADITWADTERGRGPTGTAIRSGESVCIQDFATDPQASPWRENALRCGYRSSIALPLKDDNADPFGVLNIYSTEPNAFTPGEMRLLGELGGDLAFGIVVLRTRMERKRMREELERARDELEKRVEERTSELRNANNQLECEIAERRRAEVSILESRAKYQAIVDSFDGFIYISSGDLRIEFMNRKLIERAGRDAVGEYCYKIMHDLDSACPWCVNDRVFAGETVHREMFSPKDNRWYYAVNVPIRRADGSMSKHSMIIDITDRKLFEEELRRQKELLQELNDTLEKRVEEEVAKNREKDIMLIQQNRQAALGEMLDHIAHQWKQPLSSISFIIQDLGDAWTGGELTDESVKATVDEIMSLLQHMAQTIAVFRNFYRPKKERTVFRLKDSIDIALSFVSPALRFHGIRFEVEADPGLSAVGYPSEYAQVLLNILTNAKDTFMERKKESPELKIEAFAENNKAVVTITDNAGGIPCGIIDKIFDLYFTTRESKEGTGIGLYMSKYIIEKNMGGTLGASNVDGGAQFRIELEQTGC